MKESCLFLGYKNNKTKIINFLRKKKISVTEHGNKKVTKKLIEKFDVIISYGYKKIINKKIIDEINHPIINLHISYLPFNRGSHPNYWSFINNTLKGVTIHEMNKYIDAGDIIFQKKIKFNINKKTTFKDTYKILNLEIEKLFIKNYRKIIKRKYKKKKQILKKKINFKTNLPKNFKWSTRIKEYTDKLI